MGGIRTELEPPKLRFAPGTAVVPGDRLGTTQQVFPGIGTYARGGHVHASVLGRLEVTEESPGTDLPVQFTVSVALTTTARPLAARQVLRIGQRVLCRVLRVAAPQATVEILALEGIGTLDRVVEGAIPREEAVKAAATKGSREIPDCFQPGDIVLAKVLSLGDARKYLLTTVEPELGVVHALCHSSQKPMIPCSWKEMECPDTGVREPRKCAKPRKVATAAAATTTTTMDD